ncbi:hypothetical protein ACW5R3_12225 [Bizionia sp. KMM 8389]
MNALTVYSVAKALPLEERAKLYDMLKADMIPDKPIIKKNKGVNRVEFSDEDALKYLFDKLNI